MNSSEIILYTTPDGNVKVEVILQDETVLLTQKSMGELFGVETNTINYHLKEVFKTNELEKDSVIRKIRITAADGEKYLTNFYNLDAIISVGYRVNSQQATQFRIWATKTSREFIIKGFVLDDERLKQGGQLFGKDYFDELLERIREIRASERRFYQKITDIYSECSIDYDPKAEITQVFYKTVQNKLHWAITGQTAVEKTVYTHPGKTAISVHFFYGLAMKIQILLVFSFSHCITFQFEPICCMHHSIKYGISSGSV